MTAKELIKVLEQAKADAEVIVCGTDSFPARAISANVDEYNGIARNSVFIMI